MGPGGAANGVELAVQNCNRKSASFITHARQTTPTIRSDVEALNRVQAL